MKKSRLNQAMTRVEEGSGRWWDSQTRYDTSMIPFHPYSSCMPSKHLILVVATLLVLDADKIDRVVLIPYVLFFMFYFAFMCASSRWTLRSRSKFGLKCGYIIKTSINCKTEKYVVGQAASAYSWERPGLIDNYVGQFNLGYGCSHINFALGRHHSMYKD